MKPYAIYLLQRDNSRLDGQRKMFLFRSMARQLSIRERFPPPWQVRETPSGYVVEDSKGKKIVSVFGEDEPIRRDILGYPTLAEALAVAKAIATLPDLIRASQKSDHPRGI